MWPGVIKNVGRDKSHSLKVWVNYYETGAKKSTAFRFDPVKIDLFFLPSIEHHFDLEVRHFYLDNSNYPFL